MLTHVLITQCASTSQSKTVLRHLIIIFHMHEEGINMMVGGITIHDGRGALPYMMVGGHYHT